MYKIHEDFGAFKKVSAERLAEIIDSKLLDTRLIDKPIIINSASLYLNEEGYFLRILGKDGEEGIAPCSGMASYLHLLLKEKIIPYILGKDARNMEDFLHEAFVSDLNYKIQGLAWWCCISWVESAVLDMLGKYAGVSVCELLGGRKRDELELYVASGNRHTTPEEEVEILDKRVKELGVRAVKIKLGGRMSKNADSMEGRSENLLRLVRKHFGDDMAICSDGNGSFNAEKGIEIGKITESINGYFYEEPSPFDDLWDLKTISDNLDIPIAFGEQETSLRRFAWIIENNAAQVLQPDLQYTGGFIQCIKVAKMAHEAGLVLSPHVSGGYMSYNMLLFGAIIDNPGRYHEYKGYRNAEKHTDCGLKVNNGWIKIPGGTGLGMDLSFVRDTKLVFEMTA